MRIKKILKLSAIILLIVGVMGFLALYFLLPIRPSDEELKEYFNEKGVEVCIRHEKYSDRTIRYISSPCEGDTTGNLVIFVHGAPGSAADFKAYLCDSALLDWAQLVTVDRPGYGYSGYGQSITSIEEQADFIHFVMDQFRYDKLVLVGHSYGGPIVAMVAMKYPDEVNKVILLAPLNEPESEPFYKVGFFAKWRGTRWMLPSAMGVAADEKYSHVEALNEIRNEWKKIRVPIVHIHGKKDFMAPFSNVAFSRENIPSDKLKLIVLDDANHFLPWTNYSVVKSAILNPF